MRDARWKSAAPPSDSAAYPESHATPNVECIAPGKAFGSAMAVAAQALRRILEETERKQITAALEASRWVIAGPRGAAARLGMKRSTLQTRIHKLGIARSTEAKVCASQPQNFTGSTAEMCE